LFINLTPFIPLMQRLYLPILERGKEVLERGLRPLSLHSPFPNQILREGGRGIGF